MCSLTQGVLRFQVFPEHALKHVYDYFWSGKLMTYSKILKKNIANFARKVFIIVVVAVSAVVTVA